MLYRMLEGVSVIEYGNLVSAPFCTKVLADLGAEVIKIEDPDRGDDARRCGPFSHDIPGKDRSGLFLFTNMNKLGVTLNLRTAKGKDIFAELIKNTNIFVENYSPSVMKTLGISYEYVKMINPGIIMTSITPFGQTGPYRDYKGSELINAHMGGAAYAASFDNDVSKEPIKMAARFFSFQAGLSAAMVSIGALYYQNLTGLGEHIDVSEQESVVQNLLYPFSFYDSTKEINPRIDALNRNSNRILPCKDGYIYPAFTKEEEWRRLLKVMGDPDWGDSELFKDSNSRNNNWDALRMLVSEWTTKHTMGEIVQWCQENHIAVAPVNTAENLLDSRQLAARKFFIEVEHVECGKLKYPGLPFIPSDVPKEASTPAPLLGQHNKEIYGSRLGYSDDDLVRLHEAKVI